MTTKITIISFLNFFDTSYILILLTTRIKLDHLHLPSLLCSHSPLFSFALLSLLFRPLFFFPFVSFIQKTKTSTTTTTHKNSQNQNPFEFHTFNYVFVWDPKSKLDFQNTKFLVHTIYFLLRGEDGGGGFFWIWFCYCCWFCVVVDWMCCWWLGEFEEIILLVFFLLLNLEKLWCVVAVVVDLLMMMRIWRN